MLKSSCEGRAFHRSPPAVAGAIHWEEPLSHLVTLRIGKPHQHTHLAGNLTPPIVQARQFEAHAPAAFWILLRRFAKSEADRPVKCRNANLSGTHWKWFAIDQKFYAC